MDTFSPDSLANLARDEHGNIKFYDPDTEPFLRNYEMWTLVAFIIAFVFIFGTALLNSAVPHSRMRLGARLALCSVASFALIQPLDIPRYFYYGFQPAGFLLIFGLFSATYAASLLIEWANGIFRR